MPDKDFIGVEVHTPGVGSLLKEIGEQRLTNVRVIQYDAVEVLARQWLGGVFHSDIGSRGHWDMEFTKIPAHEVTRGVKPFAALVDKYPALFRSVPVMPALPKRIIPPGVIRWASDVRLRLVLVDADAQANATLLLNSAPRPGLYDLLVRNARFADVLGVADDSEDAGGEPQ